jgi:hypothetical protein
MEVIILGKKEKYGSYICKVGYFDIRQKIEMPRQRKLSNGETQTLSGKVEVFVYHAKNRVAGPFKSHHMAVITAQELMGEGYKFKKKRK